MKPVEKRLIVMVAAGLFILLGWDSHVFFPQFQLAFLWFYIPLLFYLLAGSALLWIGTTHD